MRTLHALSLLALLLALPRQGQDETPAQDEPPAPLGGLFETERERLEEGIQGAWLLQRYDPVNAFVNPENVRGMAIFRDGYLSLNVMARSFKPEFLGDGVQIHVQGGGHRYRINEYLELQTAAVFGFQNFDDKDVIALEESGTPREYRLDLGADGATLRMIRGDGSALTWSRLTETPFPADSLDYLDRVRGK